MQKTMEKKEEGIGQAAQEEAGAPLIGGLFRIAFARRGHPR